MGNHKDTDAFFVLLLFIVVGALVSFTLFDYVAYSSVDTVYVTDTDFFVSCNKQGNCATHYSVTTEDGVEYGTSRSIWNDIEEDRLYVFAVRGRTFKTIVEILEGNNERPERTN